MRLNQLQLVDDSRLGLALVWMIIILDTAFSSQLGAARLFDLFGRTPAEHELSALDLLLLMGLTASLAGYQFHRVHRQLGLRPVADVDERLLADANVVSQRLAAGRPRFLVSANVLDGNAFCLSIGRSPTVVLGGGLRLLLRKRRQQALAIIAHECGHVSAGDTIFLLVTWYTFVAYACLQILEVALLQYSFWASIPGVYTQWISAGFGPWDFLGANLPAFLSNGFLELIETLGVGVVLTHFIRQREFRADEVAAQAGWRAPLTEALTERAADTHAQAWSLFARFHPHAAHRAARLQDESKWAKIDFVFVAAMSFALGRVLLKLPTFSEDLSERYQDMTAEELRSIAVQVMFGMVDFWLMFAFIFFFCYLATLHVHRVSLTQIRIGYSFLARSATGLTVVTATFLGSLLNLFLHSLLNLSSLAGFLETAARGQETFLFLLLLMNGALLFALLSAFFCWGSVMATTILARRAAQSGLAHTARLAAITLSFGFLAYVMVTNSFVSVVEALDLRFLVFYLPDGNSEFLGSPSLLGILVIVAGFLVLFAAMKLDRRRVTPKLHPSWLVRDEVPNPP
ncbi:MAG: M48 family metalloprotease [Roseomonas sp.]|nr:M48 family metalloprotease [Roseomonas sp.]MCA3316355.1 M48 family metalloprotease [Roseomonas sp.]MCA3319977.1 M48 family metalloprotease [Roseomonas sp.]